MANNVHQKSVHFQKIEIKIPSVSFSQKSENFFWGLWAVYLAGGGVPGAGDEEDALGWEPARDVVRVTATRQREPLGQRMDCAEKKSVHLQREEEI